MLAFKRRLVRLRNRVYRIASTNASYLIGSRGRNGDFARVGSTFIPWLARVNRNVQIPEQRLLAFASVKSLLKIGSVCHWTLPTRTNRPTIIGVSDADRDRVLELLTEDSNFSHWYIETLSHRGSAYGAVRMASHAEQLKNPAGIRLYEIVRQNSLSSFGTTKLQGVEIHFWNQEGPLLKSRVWNERIVELPVPADQVRNSSELLSAWTVAANDVKFPIDVVYTWVDGSDENWLRSKASALKIENSSHFTDNAIDEARFADHDELRFSLRSIDQFAPWVRKIWLVTAGQTPQWLDSSNPRIQIVKHEDIWPSPAGLPTFNSHAIEANLHKISGLAEHYLYFNDDVMLGRPVAPELFFHPNGITKFFHSRALVDFGPTLPGESASTTAAKNARTLIEEAFNVTFSRKFYHVPAPISRTVMNEAESSFPKAFQQTRESSFRKSTDIAASGSLYLNYAYATGHAVPGSIRYDYIDPATTDGRARMEKVILRRSLDVICVNDGATAQTVEQREDTDRYIREALGRMYPVKSSFEL